MRIGIMQPYFFPYLGYFQLIAATERFVIYDDVNYIKGGWINRNNLLLNDNPHRITVPLKEASSFKKINEIAVFQNGWQKKLLSTLTMAYRKAPYYETVYPLLDSIISFDQAAGITDLNFFGIKTIAEYLKIATVLIPSSSIYGNQGLSGAERVIDICKKEKGTHYINPIGGSMLYDKTHFKQQGLDLSFIQMKPVNYTQYGGSYIPYLSIIDVLMFNDIETINELLQEYELS